MSVTFTTQAPVVALTVVCCDGVARDTRTWPADTSHAVIDREHAAVCSHDLCDEGGLVEPVYTIPGEPVNVGHYRAPDVLEALGYTVAADGDMCGNADPGDFLGRVLLAFAIAPTDEGMPARRALPGERIGLFPASEGGPAVFDAGRPAGYLQDILGRLRELAEVAQAHGLRVTWG